MKSRFVVALIGTLLTVSTAFTAATPAQAGPKSGDHQRIIDFWTRDRIARAVPRDFVRNPDGTFQLAKTGVGKPAPSVQGADWTGDGTVQHNTGKVLFALGSSYYVCSASVITDTNTETSTILTAGHCVYDQATSTWATHWMFVPDYDTAPIALTTDESFCAQTQYGCWTAQAATINSAFKNQATYNAIATWNDVAFVTVGTGGKSGIAQLDSVVVPQAIHYSKGSLGASAWLFGYPAASPFDGKRLIYSLGTLGTDPLNANKTYRVASTMTGGCSGGPWFQPFDSATGSGTIISLNSYTYSGLKAMHGPMLTYTTQTMAEKAGGATENQVVG